MNQICEISKCFEESELGNIRFKIGRAKVLHCVDFVQV